jgi:hypothetical protein
MPMNAGGGNGVGVRPNWVRVSARTLRSTWLGRPGPQMVAPVLSCRARSSARLPTQIAAARVLS